MLTTPAFASEHCVDTDSHIEMMVDTMPMGEVVDQITGDELTTFLAAFNATSPRTNYTGDRVVIVASEIVPSRIYAILSQGACVVFGGMIKADTIQKYKLGIPLSRIGWTI